MERIPSKPNPIFRFASLIHSILYRYHFYEKRASLERLLFHYERAWNRKKGPLYEEGKKILYQYYEKMGKDTPYALEERFKVKVGENILIGKFDRVDKKRKWVSDCGLQAQ